LSDPAFGYWIAFHSDWSAFRVFSEEILALRFAVENQHMDVKFVQFGDDPREAK
jgi:hypothetical protein